MTLLLALERFERVLGTVWPEWLERTAPGADDATMGRLADAVRPYEVPEQVDTLYRWRNGCEGGLFGGWRMRPIDDLIRWYEVTVDGLGSPPVWLPVFEDQIVSIVTLDIPARPPSDTSVWYGHTHDKWLWRMCDSLGSLVDVVSDAAEAGELVDRFDRLALPNGDSISSLDSRTWDAWRLARNPGTFTWPNPPAGTELPRNVHATWPAEWLEPFGIDENYLTLRGVTHTIAQLIAESTHGPVAGTIRGTVTSGAGFGGGWYPVVTDSTGSLVVEFHGRSVPIRIPVDSEAEFDVVLGSPDPPDPPDPTVIEDPVVARIAQRMWPALPRAVATAARPIDRNYRA